MDDVGISVGSPCNDALVWEPTSFFDPNCNWLAEGRPPFALLILNLEISNRDLLGTVWNKASLRVCADGGANRLHDALGSADRSTFLPNCVVGDLDSIRDDVKGFYERHEVDVIRDTDQYSTDFGKCMAWIRQYGERFESGRKLTVVVLGGFGGRVDQSFHSVHALYADRQENSLAKRQMFLISKESITFLLEPGRNRIVSPRSMLGPTCGIIPLGGPAVLTTRGLEWDLDAQESKIGGLVSTSNHLQSDMVFVETNEPVLFTVELTGHHR